MNPRSDAPTRLRALARAALQVPALRRGAAVPALDRDVRALFVLQSALPAQLRRHLDVSAVLDRIPILLGIAIVYFGFRATNWMAAAGFALVMAVPLIATMRNRQGLALALDYLSRVYLPDPSDEIHGGRELSESEAAALR